MGGNRGLKGGQKVGKVGEKARKIIKYSDLGMAYSQETWSARSARSATSARAPPPPPNREPGDDDADGAET